MNIREKEGGDGGNTTKKTKGKREGRREGGREGASNGSSVVRLVPQGSSYLVYCMKKNLPPNISIFFQSQRHKRTDGRPDRTVRPTGQTTPPLRSPPNLSILPLEEHFHLQVLEKVRDELLLPVAQTTQQIRTNTTKEKKTRHSSTTQKQPRRPPSSLQTSHLEVSEKVRDELLLLVAHARPEVRHSHVRLLRVPQVALGDQDVPHAQHAQPSQLLRTKKG